MGLMNLNVVGMFSTSALLLGACVALNGCQSHRADRLPAIEFTNIPPSAQGGREKVDTIAGRVTGAHPGQQLVIYAHSGAWWVQPTVANPFTSIQTDIYQFVVPSGPLPYSMRWEAGHAKFTTVRGNSPGPGAPVISEHEFTSGIASPGQERVQLFFYVVDNDKNPLQHDNEVVLEKFEYLP